MRTYRFDEFVFDASSGELRKGCYRQRLRPQPTAALAYLLQHRGAVVTRGELRRVLWPDGTFVHFDHGLNSCIKQIRAALSDRRLTPRYLETLPRRGYRFIGEVLLDDASRTKLPSAEFTLSGSVRVTGRQLHVAIQLTDRSDSARVWTTRFDRDLTDGRGSRSSIASRIIDLLGRDEASETT